MANIKSLSLYRNTSSLFVDKDAAIAAIEAQNPGDGVAILARYKAGDDIKTLLGLQATTSAITGAQSAGITGSTYKTIIDVEGNEEKIEEILAQLEALSGSTGDTSATTSVAGAKAYTDDKVATLDYTDTAQTGYYISKVDEADGVISVTREALPTVAAITEAGKPIVAVAESLGEISASAGTIDAQYVNVADAGNLFTATTVEAVLAEIDAAYKAADEAIVNNASESANTLAKLEDIVNELSSDAKEYHIVKATTGLPETIKERYSLVDADGNVSGDTIDVPKDSHIVSINYITAGTHAQNLEYVYIDASGNTQTTYVDMSELVLETEFASGVTVTDHIAHGVVDPTSEAFLTVGADGFKLAGVQTAINTAIEALDVTSDTAVDGQYVAAIEETDGVVAVKTRANVSEAVLNNYVKGSDASAVTSSDTVNEAISKLENQIDNVGSAATTVVAEGTDAGNNMSIVETAGADGHKIFTINLSDVASDTALDELSGKSVTAIDMTGGTAAITAATDGTKKITINTDGSQINLTNYSKGSDSGAVASTDTVNAAISKLENQIDAANDAIDALDYTGVTTGTAVVVTNVTEENGLVAASSANVGTLTLDGYTKGSDSGNVAASDSINAAIAKLENHIDGNQAIINAAIAAMDMAVVSGAGQVITSVSEENGVVSAEATDLVDITLTNYAKNTALTGDLAATDSVEEALSKLENNIAAAATTAALAAADESVTVVTASTGTTVAVKIKSNEKVLALDNTEGAGGLYTDIKLSGVTPSSTTVKEEYALLATDGSQLGSTIKIYKDSSLVSITYITDPSDPHYQNLEYVYIDASGNTQTEYVDISSLVLEAEFVSGVAANADGQVHGVVDTTSEAFLTVGANGFKLAGVQDAIDAAVNGLDASESGSTDTVSVKVVQTDGKVSSVVVETLAELLSGVTVNGKSATVANHVASVVISGSDINVGDYTNQGAGDPISGGNTIAEAFSGVVSTIMSNELVTSAALNDLNERVNEISGTVTDYEVVGASGVTASKSGNTTTVSAVAPAKNTEDNSLDNPITITQNGIEFATTLDCGTY